MQYSESLKALMAEQDRKTGMIEPTLPPIEETQEEMFRRIVQEELKKAGLI